MKMWGERGRLAMYIGCVYMSTDSTSVAVLDTCFERFKEDILSFQVLGFTKSVSQKVEPLVQEVVHEWKDTVNRVAKSVVGEKTIVCGKSARWWDNDKINRRCKVYKKVVSSRKELWDEYCRLRKEVKEAVREKLSIWNEMVEKVNADFERSRKEFWAFVGRRTKGKYTSMKRKAGVSVSSTQCKLEILRKHYEELGKVSVHDNFEADWEEVVSTLETCSHCQR